MSNKNDNIVMWMHMGKSECENSDYMILYAIWWMNVRVRAWILHWNLCEVSQIIKCKEVCLCVLLNLWHDGTNNLNMIY